jgi:hypothetical protein
VAVSARYVSHGRISPAPGNSRVYSRHFHPCYETRSPICRPPGYQIRVSWQGPARIGSFPAFPIFPPYRLNRNPRLGSSRYVSHSTNLSKRLKALGLWFVACGALATSPPTPEAKSRVRIRVSWHGMRSDTCLMAGWGCSDSCLTASSYVSRGRLEAFGYVSHGRFLRVSWQDNFPKSLLYKPFPILQNTENSCNNINNRGSHVEIRCCCSFC